MANGNNFEEIKHWEVFTCLLPPKVLVLLEEQLERVRNLANIDPDDKLSQEVRDGLCLELILADFAGTSDDSVI
jgi:hypothetical protein